MAHQTFHVTYHQNEHNNKRSSATTESYSVKNG